MTRIRSASARRIYDSRGRETIEVSVSAESGDVGIAGAPSGASTGTHEVLAFPAGGVAAALATFHDVVGPALVGLEVADQEGVDAALHAADGTGRFERIGGNTATAASIAVARANAAERGLLLWEALARSGVDGSKFPAVVGNCLNGGRHAIGGPEIQEFIAFAPEAAPGDSVRVAIAVHAALGAALHARFPDLALGRGDEGGWVAPVGSLEALEMLSAACAKASSELHLAVHPGLDLAASEFFRDGRYHYKDRSVDPEGQVDFVTGLVDRFGLRYVEDPFDQEDFRSFASLTAAVGQRCLVVGDDLYTTDLERVRSGAAQRASNAVLIKVNQVGTLSDTLATVDFCRANGLETVTSHRSGDLPDGWLAHLALASGAAGIKCGLLGGERVAKLNELLRLGGPREGPPR